MDKKTFVLASGEINTYGSIVLTEGISTTFFSKNPVMRYMHVPGFVIGRWKELRLVDGQWLADPDFDLKDPKAKEIARKVDDGFINAASISVWPIEGHIEMRDGVEVMIISKSELREASIVDIPSDRSALKLVDESGREITSVLNLSDFVQTKSNFNTKRMENKELARILGLSDSASDAEITTAVSGAVKSAKELKDFQAQAKVEAKQRAITLADAAIADGRIDASLKTDLLELADANFTLFEKTLANYAKPVSLSDTLRGAVLKQTGAAVGSGRDAWTFLEWQKQDPVGLGKLELSDNAKFKALYKAEYGEDYID